MEVGNNLTLNLVVRCFTFYINSVLLFLCLSVFNPLAGSIIFYFVVSELFSSFKLYVIPPSLFVSHLRKGLLRGIFLIYNG